MGGTTETTEMSTLSKSLKRLYSDKKLTVDKIGELLTKNTIVQEEYKYILE